MKHFPIYSDIKQELVFSGLTSVLGTLYDSNKGGFSSAVYLSFIEFFHLRDFLFSTSVVSLL